MPKIIGVTELTSIDNADLIEQGFGINYDDVWATIQSDLPKLKPQIETALKLLEKIDNE